YTTLFRSRCSSPSARGSPSWPSSPAASSWRALCIGSEPRVTTGRIPMASRTNQPFPGLAHAERRSQPACDAGAPWVEGNARTLALAAASGAVFGFLLQKGGVAKFDILLGVLLLENFVVAKVMLTAIVVGMIGFHLLAKRGAVEAQIKPVAYGSNLIGGLVFGAGFALMAY